MHKQKELRLMIQNIALKTKEETLILSRKGRKSNWLMDLREVLLDSSALDLVTDLFWEKMSVYFPFQIAGEELSSVPLIAALLQKGEQKGFSTNGLIIRKERKKSGLCKKIEGELKNLPILLVDDLTNGASAFLNMYETLKMEGRSVDYFFTIVDFENPKGKELIREKSVKYFSLFKLSDFGLSLNKAKKKKSRLRYFEAKRKMNTSFSNPDFFYQNIYDGFIRKKPEKYLFLTENASLISLNLTKKKNELLYDSKISLPQIKKTNLIFDQKKKNAYFFIGSSELACFSFSEKQIKWSIGINNLRGKIQESANFLVYSEEKGEEKKLSLKVIKKNNAELFFEKHFTGEVSYFIVQEMLFIYDSTELTTLNFNNLLEETLLKTKEKGLKLLGVRSNGEKIFMQAKNRILIYNIDQQIIFDEEFAFIKSFFIDDEILCLTTLEKQFFLYKNNELEKKLLLPTAQVNKFYRKNECLYFSSDYGIFLIELNSLKKFCILRTVEKIISFQIVSDSEIIVHLAGNQLSYFTFHEAESSSTYN